MQSILVFIALIIAAGYLGRLFFRSFFSKDTSCAGCSACSTIDFKKIEAEIAKKYTV